MGVWPSSVGHEAIPSKARRVYRDTVIAWFRQHGRDFPWRRTRNRYAVLISEVLLQRTRSDLAVETYREFLRRWPDPAKLSRARLSTIARVIRPLGLTKRAETLKKLGSALVDLGGVPGDPRSLLSLPGIGPYAAHSVPVFTASQRLPVVDWVIARVLRRYFGLPDGSRPNADPALWEIARLLAAEGRARPLWLGTLDFGAEICRPKPRCPICPLNRTCKYAQEAQVGIAHIRPRR